jgi:hypothetical protein
MKNVWKKTGAVLAIAGITTFGFFGCGSSASNDQGVAFTFMGWFAEIDEDGNLLPLVVECDDLPPQISDFTVSLGYAFGEFGYSSGGWPDGELSLWAGALNNLQGQTIRVDKMNLSYNIPGAINQPPDTAAALGVILGPPPALPATNGPQIPDNSSLPIDPNTTPLCNQNYDFTPLLPTAIKEWLSFHRDEIPEAPFRIVVTAQLSGVTSAGDRLYSNEISFGITVTPDNPILPGVPVEADEDEASDTEESEESDSSNESASDEQADASSEEDNSGDDSASDDETTSDDNADGDTSTSNEEGV